MSQKKKEPQRPDLPPEPKDGEFNSDFELRVIVATMTPIMGDVDKFLRLQEIFKSQMLVDRDAHYLYGMTLMVGAILSMTAAGYRMAFVKDPQPDGK